MKKTLKALFFVIMTLALTLFAINCGKTGSTSDSVGESVSEPAIESVSESVYVPTPEPIIGAGENGEVNLGDALDLLSPILNNDYITVNFVMQASASQDSVEVETSTSVQAYVKRTVRGYDVIANFVQTAEAQGQSMTVATISIYYVDGLAVYGLKEEGDEEMTWAKTEVGSFNGLINSLNGIIAGDEEALATYHEVMKAVEQLEIILSEQDLTDISSGISLDISEYVSDVLVFIVANKDVNLYDFILQNLFGIDVANTEEVANFEQSIKDVCSANPTLAYLIDEAVAMVNANIMESARQEAEANGVEFDEDRKSVV